MIHPYQQAIESLTARLQLRPVSSSSQSWEVEVADAEALPAYQTAYESGDLTEMERKVLVRIMLEALEQAAKRLVVVSDALLQRMASVILAEYRLHHDTLLLWALPGETRNGADYVYRITPFVRAIMRCCAE